MLTNSTFSMFRAEWDKIGGNWIWSTFLIWIFPIGALTLGVLGIIAALLSDEFLAEQRTVGVYTWDEALLASWEIVNNIVGRWIIISFAAWVFASEYKNGTWKNLATRRGRVRLIVNKFITLAIYVTVAFTTMSLIFFFGNWVMSDIVGTDYGLSTAGDVMGDFLPDYAANVFLTLTGTLISAAFAAAAAMVTKNVFASVIVGILFYMFEFVGIFFFVGLVQLITGVDISVIIEYLPSFNLESISAVLLEREGFENPAPLEQSLVIVGLWAVGLVAVTAWLFRRQDITV